MTYPLVNLEDLSKNLSVHTSTLRGWIKKGIIPKHTYISVGTCRRFNLEAVIDSLTAAKETITKNESTEDNLQTQLDFNSDPFTDVISELDKDI